MKMYCGFLTLLYVGSLYLVPSHIRELPRDNVTHMKARMIASGGATLISLILSYILWQDNLIPDLGESFWMLIGLRWDNIGSSLIVTMILMMIFYEESMYIVDGKGQLSPRKENIGFHNALYNNIERMWDEIDCCPWLAFRNLLLAPFTEEVVFRALMIPLIFHSSCSTGMSSVRCIFVVALQVSLWFSTAHVHHIYEKFRLGMTLSSILGSTILQIVYTSIFACISVILFMRTGNIIAPLLSHIICNFQGLPDLSFVRKPGFILSGRYSYLFEYRYWLIIVHALGLVIFSISIFPLTANLAKSSLYSMR